MEIVASGEITDVQRLVRERYTLALDGPTLIANSDAAKQGSTRSSNLARATALQVLRVAGAKHPARQSRLHGSVCACLNARCCLIVIEP